MPHLSHALLLAVTDLGDSAVLIGMIGLVALYLTVAGCRRTALILLAAFATTAACIGILKILFFSCHQLLPLPFALKSPSGHAALTMAAWGTLGAILGQHFSDWRRWLPLAFALPLIGVIAWTRLMLGFHSAAEIITGLGVGLTGCGLGLFLLSRYPVQKFSALGIVAAALAAALLLHGLRLPAETFMKLLAQQLQLYWPMCTTPR